MLRRDKCKCGRIMMWSEDATIFTCRYCGTQYSIESDDIIVYWLKERVERVKPYKTDAREHKKGGKKCTTKVNCVISC